MPESSSAADEPVGSLAEEAARLFAALATNRTVGAATQDRDAADEHAGGGGCPHRWCPLCQGADYLSEHPDLVVELLAAGAEFMRVIGSVIDRASGSSESSSEQEPT